MIADLHCHYPMHLLPTEAHPHDASGNFLERLKHGLEARAVALLARYLNDRSPTSGWRVDLDGLQAGGARLVCSVLYAPPDEFDIDRSYGSPPGPGYFADLRDLLEGVEHDLARLDPGGARHVIARRAADLQDGGGRIAFAHCVEGGFHLGGDETEIEGNVAWLARRGVIYVTLAHLFFRDVATNAPAIPLLSDGEYETIFPQPPKGLTTLGEAAVRAMYRHKVLVDISHMSERAIADTFALLEELDEETGAAPQDHPVIATHVGIRSADPDRQEYNLSPETIAAVKERGGLIGLIMAQHQLGSTRDAEQSRAVVRRHLDALAADAGGHQCTAIGTDLDGFIRPTLAGIERARDLAVLSQWVRDDYPDDADAILHANAERVLTRVYAARA